MKNIVKRALVLLLAMTMLALVACGGSGASAPSTSAAPPAEEASAPADSAENSTANEYVEIDESSATGGDLPAFETILQEDGKWPLKEDGSMYKIGMSIPTVQEEIWQLQQTLIEEDAAARGYEAVIQVANNDADKQIQQLQSLASQGVDGIWVGAHDASLLGPVITEISEMGIPVVSQTRLPVDCPIAYHLNTDNTVLGEIHSDYIVNQLEITSGNFVILKGDARQITDVPQMYNGMMTYIQPYVDSGDINIVLEQNCEDWKAEEAMKHAESALTLSNNDIDVFVCMNDGIASGVISVLEQKGLAGEVVVTGMDCEIAALKRVEAGTQWMTIYKDIPQMIRELANACLAAKLNVQPNLEPNYIMDNGYGDIPTISMGAELVTKDNMKDVLENSYIDLDEVLNG